MQPSPGQTGATPGHVGRAHSPGVLLAVLLGVLAIAAACSSEPSPIASTVVSAPTAATATPAEASVAPTALSSAALSSAALSPPAQSDPPPKLAAEAATIADAEAESERFRIEYGIEPDQFAWLQLPAGPAPEAGHPVVVLIHGGFWRQQFDASLMNALADDLATHGYASWNVEYRRVDGAGGWPLTGDDVRSAIDHLADVRDDHLIDLDRVVSVGHSAGGHLGLWALNQELRVNVRGSVGLGAVVDLAFFPQAQGLLGGSIDQVPDVYAAAAPVLDPERVVLIHGGNDFIVPEQSLQLARDESVPIMVVEGDDHFDLIDATSDSWAATLDVIKSFVS